MGWAATSGTLSPHAFQDAEPACIPGQWWAWVVVSGLAGTGRSCSSGPTFPARPPCSSASPLLQGHRLHQHRAPPTGHMHPSFHLCLHWPTAGRISSCPSPFPQWPPGPSQKNHPVPFTCTPSYSQRTRKFPLSNSRYHLPTLTPTSTPSSPSITHSGLSE